MKMWMPNLCLRRGYTIDQTILIIAIIAILITLVIVTVGWNLINRTTSTKLGAQLRQLEGVNGEFFSTYGVWPTEAYTEPSDIALSVLALTGGTGVTYTSDVLARGGGKVRNFLPGARIANGAVRHSFSNTFYSPGVFDGPGIYQAAMTNPQPTMQGTYLVLMLDDVLLGEAKLAEKDIDGANDPSSGRVVMGVAQTGCHIGGASNLAANASDSDLVDLCYVANRIR